MGLNVCQDADQRDRALKLANVVRTTNAKTIREIGELSMIDGFDRLIEILRTGDEKGPLGSVKIGRLLGAPKGMGHTKVDTLLRASMLTSGDRRLGRLTTHQRETLAGYLERPDILWAKSVVAKQRTQVSA